MILAIDIGNSTIGFGLIENSQVVRVFKVENQPQNAKAVAKLESILGHAASRHVITRIIICSVVPEATRQVKKFLQKYFDAPIQIVGCHIRVPIRNRYRSPRQVGKDRLLCAFAARELYGVPSVVIDLGTAITFDGISSQGDYLGGAIIPGIRLSTEALFEKTALLPMARVQEPDKVIGRSTQESIQSGIFHGYGALCDGMVDRLAGEMGHKLTVVMTGGHAEIMRKFMKRQGVVVDQALIFKGMALLANA